MKQIANSQLCGKWYSIARTYNHFEIKFFEIFIYISISCEKYLDMLYVGIKEDRTKVLKKITLKILTKNGSNFIALNKGLFRKKLKVLTFDEKDGILILADEKMKYVSILSRKSELKHEVVEKCLNSIGVFEGKELKLYGNSIF